MVPSLLAQEFMEEVQQWGIHGLRRTLVRLFTACRIEGRLRAGRSLRGCPTQSGAWA
jgi:hypothetical protein